MSLEIKNPFASGTFNSKLFRIPVILTLKNGRILAVADVRYGNGTDDPANVDTGIRYSDDNGVNWSESAFVNAFDDMEFCDHNKAIPTSASFVDSAIVQGDAGEVIDEVSCDNFVDEFLNIGRCSAGICDYLLSLEITYVLLKE